MVRNTEGCSYILFFNVFYLKEKCNKILKYFSNLMKFILWMSNLIINVLINKLYNLIKNSQSCSYILFYKLHQKTILFLKICSEFKLRRDLRKNFNFFNFCYFFFRNIWINFFNIYQISWKLLYECQIILPMLLYNMR